MENYSTTIEDEEFRSLKNKNDVSSNLSSNSQSVEKPIMRFSIMVNESKLEKTFEGISLKILATRFFITLFNFYKIRIFFIE